MDCADHDAKIGCKRPREHENCSLQENGNSQGRVTIVFENPNDAQNVDRILATCGAFRVDELLLVFEKAKPFDTRCLIRKSSAKSATSQEVSGGSAVHTSVQSFASTAECVRYLSSKRYLSVATSPHPPSKNLYSSSMAANHNIALWFGEEKHGLTDEAISAASSRVFVPTVGMVESLNVASCVAVTLAEVRRQQSSVNGSTFQEIMPENHASVEDRTTMANISCQPENAITQERMDKFRKLAQKRQAGLVVVLEDPDRKDAGAILRSCDAFGVAEVLFVFARTRAFDPLANRQTMKSGGSNLWVCSRVFNSVLDCAQHLSSKGYMSLAVVKNEATKTNNLFGSRLTEHKCLAFWFGGEHGLSEDALAVSSLNLIAATSDMPQNIYISNLVAVTLAEVVRQRSAHPHSDQWVLGSSDQEAIVNWCVAVYLKRHPNAKRDLSLAEDCDTKIPERPGLSHLREELNRQGW